MRALLAAIVDDDTTKVRALLKADARLAVGRMAEPRLYRSGIFHWIYAGDTVLHLAAAGYRVEIIRLLLAAGADADAAGTHRHSTPLHYAADGSPGAAAWNPRPQVQTIHCLLEAGADINAQDKNGATPLHRAVRTRCAAAVKCLLESGAKPTLRNLPGSTPFHLAVQNTGRGGSGVAAAKEAQRQIIDEFLTAGVSPAIQDARGKSVLDWARSDWIRAKLNGK